jgi:histidyl-tRNA synthetase
MMITAVKGTQDLFAPEILRWQKLETAARNLFERYGFGEIRTPLLEHTELFVRGIGDETDIVTKEMYTFPDRKGRSLTLRPENTAGVMRALVEHRLCDSSAHSRLYYIGPQFRYERPQKGRYRQFHQIGAEVIGDASPGSDAETIALAADLLSASDILGPVVQLNSVGCPKCRPSYVGLLRGALLERRAELCGDCQRRLEANPLRVLDCKVPSCQPILDEAPRLDEGLCEECHAHHEKVKELLGLLGVSFQLKPRLVRGLDYYVRTVFEITSSALGAQDALLGGGRYDGLLKQIGGPDAPGFGWALGVERLLMAMPPVPEERLGRTYIAWSGEGTYARALSLARDLRARGLPVIMEHSERSFKSSLKRADRLNVRWALLLGEDELKAEKFTLKDLQTGEQEALPAGELAARILNGGAS